MWKKQLKQSFGIVDKRFAGHPADAARAREVRSAIKEGGLGAAEIEEEIRRILEGCEESHIEAQLTAAWKFFKF